jgi:two-component system OmpR family sensor kinase
MSSAPETPLPARARRRSFRARLLKLFLLASAACWLLSAVLVFVVAERENAADWAGGQEKLGRMVLALARHEYQETGSLEALGPNGSFDSPELMIQIWSPDGSLLLRSREAPGARLSSISDRFVDRVLGTGSWRVRAFRDVDSGLTIEIGEHSKRRRNEARQLALALLTPVLVGLPLLTLIAWAFSQRALRPMRRAAARIQSRGERDFSPISDETLPLEVEPLVDAFNALLHKLEALFDDQKLFAATVAHELRTPLASLRLDLQLMREAQPQVGKVPVERPLRCVERVTKIIEQLVTLARLDLALARGETAGSLDLQRVAEETVREFSARIEARQLQVDIEIPRLDLHCPEQAAYIVLRNLLDNATRHAGSPGRVIVSGGRRDHECWIAVEDDGPGLDAAPAPDPEPHGSLKLGWVIIDRIAYTLGAQLSRGTSATLGGARVEFAMPRQVS